MSLLPLLEILKGMDRVLLRDTERTDELSIQHIKESMLKTRLYCKGSSLAM